MSANCLSAECVPQRQSKLHEMVDRAMSIARRTEELHVRMGDKLHSIMMPEPPCDVGMDKEQESAFPPALDELRVHLRQINRMIDGMNNFLDRCES